MIPNPITGKPRLFVMEHCENLIKEIPKYRYLDQRGTEGNKRNAAELPADCDDHAIDALRYAIYSDEMRNMRGTAEGRRLIKNRDILSMPQPTQKRTSYGNLLN